MKLIRLILCWVVIFLYSIPALGKNTIDIAAIYALTGAAAEANSYALQGVRYAVNELNSRGGILGKKINLKIFDNQSTPIGSTIAAKQAATAEVVAIVGPDWSSHSISVARVAQKVGIPMISSLSTNPAVTRVGNYIFRICFTDDFQGVVIAKFARHEIKATSAVVFVDVSSDYSIKLSNIFRDNFESLGGQVLREIEYKHNQLNFDNEIESAVKAEADVMFIPGHDESGFIAKKAQDRGSSSIFLGGDGWSTPVFFKKGGAELDKGYFSTHWSVGMDSDISKSFVSKYSIAADSPEDNVALGYDAMMLLGDAIARADSTNRQKIRAAIAETNSFKAITGTINFNEHGDPIKSAVIMEIVNGKPRYMKTIHP
jgi:branched-chain amino acid transport system substrate-binding protein